MAPQQAEISIPSTSTASPSSKPYTVYNITLRLPLRSFVVAKRFSDFVTLHENLTSQAGSAPPLSLPQKTWFAKTTSNSDLAEQRRKELEAYLLAINTSEDNRWRNTTAWRTFLNLPSSIGTNASKSANDLHSAITGPGSLSGAEITDPTVWLDCHRELKSQLHDARLHLTRRDQATAAQGQHEASAAAKSCLVKAQGNINTLEKSLKSLGKSSGWGGSTLGEGELRRRRDLISSARKEKEGLDNLLNAMVQKSKIDSAVATAQQSSQLMGNGAKTRNTGRVLGKETDKTRELDNQGVLSLQKQMLQDQDLDIGELGKIISRQKQLATEINEELVVQTEMLGMVEEDADRVQGKIDIAKKRIGKIS